VSVARQVEQNRMQHLVVVEGARMQDDLRALMTGLLRPSEYEGALRVVIKQRGASVFVDDLPRGFSPLKAPVTLVPGTHKLFVGLEGFRAHVEDIEVPFGGAPHLVKVDLVPGVLEGMPAFIPSMPPPLAPAVAVEEKKKPSRALRVALYDVDVGGGSARLGRVLTQCIAGELRKLERVSVMGMDEIRAIVVAQQMQAKATDDPYAIGECKEDEACLSEVAEALGADVVVLSQVNELNGEIHFGMRRIDQATQQVAGSYTRRLLADDTDALLEEIPIAIERVFKEIPLRVGETRGVDDVSRLRLRPPPVPVWTFWSLVGASGVAAVTSAAAGSVFALSQAQYREIAALGTVENPADGGALRSELEVATASNVTMWFGIGATALFGTASAIAAPFTDWNGYAAE